MSKMNPNQKQVVKPGVLEGYAVPVSDKIPVVLLIVMSGNGLVDNRGNNSIKGKRSIVI